MTHQAILKVAERLGELLDDVVVVGGCAGLLLMPPGDLEFRPTDDVDLVVPCLMSTISGPRRQLFVPISQG